MPSPPPPHAVDLGSFGTELRVAIIGASGGIGGALTALLADHPEVARVHALARRPGAGEHPRISPHRLDLEDEASIAAAAASAGEEGPLDLVIVATGILHDGSRLQPEKTWRALDAAALARAFQVNTIGPALVAKHFLPLLRRDRKAVFAALSARVGSIGDNRLGGWHAYRASKAALNMLLRTLAIELARRHPEAVCVGLHPGTVETGLSAPFRSGVPDGRLFTPTYAATRLLQVLDGLSADDSGRVFAWDGQVVPF